MGSFIGITRWNYDNDYSYVSTYEYVYRLAAGVIAVPYLAPALGFFYMITQSVTKASETVIYGYYLTSFASVISPLLGFFLVELLYLYCYATGNDSGIYVQNKPSYFLWLAHMLTYQGISLMVFITTIPALKVWY